MLWFEYEGSLSAYAVTHVSKTLSLDAGAEKRQLAETGEMAQLGKCLPHKHKDPS